MPEYFLPFDFGSALDSAETIEIFLRDVFECENAGALSDALAIVARAEGLSALAKKIGIPSEEIATAFNAQNNLASNGVLTILAKIGLPTEVIERVNQVSPRSGWA